MVTLGMCLVGTVLPTSYPYDMPICEDHEEMLPEGVKPMLMPDTQNEVGTHLLFLETKKYLASRSRK